MAFFRLTLLSLLSTFLLFLSSCDLNEPKPASREEILAGTDVRKGWQISSIESIAVGTKGAPRECIQDNLIFYYVDGRYIVSEGRSLCDAQAPQSLEGGWTLIDDETIRIEIGDSIQIWNIDRLTENQQIISSTFIEGSRIYTLNSSN